MDDTAVIDLTNITRLVVQGFVIPSKGTVDNAEMSLHLYKHTGKYKDPKRIENLEHVGVLRITKPILEELVLQANQLLGTHIQHVEEFAKK